MRRAFVFCAALLLLTPAAFVFAAGGGTASSGAPQPKPVVFFSENPYSATDADMQRLIDYYEAQTGIQIKTRYAKTWNEYTTQLPTAIAAQDDVDVVRNSGKIGMMDYKTRGISQDITDAVNRYGTNMKKVFTSDVWKSVTVGGRIWAIPDGYENNTGVVISIRKDWREKLGMGPISTLKDFVTYLTKVRDADFDGNGKADTIPLLPYYKADGLDQTVLYAYIGALGINNESAQATYIDDKGNVVPTVLHPKFKDYLQDMATWYKNGLIYSDALASNGDEFNDLVATNRVGAIASWYSDFFTGWQTLVQKVPNAVYEIIILKGPDGVARLNTSTPGAPGAEIVSWSKVADYAVRFMDYFMASPENYLSQYHGQPVVDWQFVDKSKSTRKITKTDSSKTFHSFITYYKWNGQPVSTDWRQLRYDDANAFMSTQTPYLAKDWLVPYDFKGTTIEKANIDASTLLNEAIAQIITNKRSINDWDSVVTQWRKMYGDDFVKIATQQYKAFK